jgi:hypothetical protein
MPARPAMPARPGTWKTHVIIPLFFDEIDVGVPFAEADTPFMDAYSLSALC